MARLHCALGHLRSTLIRAGILPGSMSVFMRNGTAAIARSLSWVPHWIGMGSRATNWVFWTKRMEKTAQEETRTMCVLWCFVFVLKHPIWGYAKKIKKGYRPSNCGFAARSFSGHVSGPAKDLRVQAFLFRERTGFVMRVAQGMDAF